MKHIIRKALLALMVGIGMMGAVSVQAQTQEKVWVRIGEYYSQPNVKYYGDQAICNFWVQHEKGRTKPYDQDIYWTGEVINYFYATMPYKGCVVVNSVYSRLSFKPLCDQGIYSHDRPDGCYEQKDKCPEGMVKGEGNVCELSCKNGEVAQPDGSCGCPEGKEKDGEECLDECELAEKHGTPLPEGCPDCSKDFPFVVAQT